MTSWKLPTRFNFDFGHAGRVTWTHGRNDASLEENGIPARFSVDDAEIADNFAQMVKPMLADLVDIAIAIHMADRLAVRTLNCRNTWSRRLHLKICVRYPELWADAAMRKQLEELLAFLTEDIWTFDFVVHRDPRRTSEIQAFLFPGGNTSISSISLFSGGLDSLAGTSAAISKATGKHFILVSASPNFRQRLRQQHQVKILREELGAKISHVSIPYGMQNGDQYAQEPSRRTRGFLFLVLGGVTAISAGCSALTLYENGLGAINLPYDQSQIGTDNARAVHPRVLRYAAALLSNLAEQPFSVLNPCIYLTKAEMVRPLAADRTQRAIPLTFSCDGFPVRTKGHSQCGFCTSCLLRRFSLEIAGLQHLDSSEYLRDWKSNSFVLSKHHLRGLRAMDWQVLRFQKCFEARDSWSALTLEFPELRALLNDLCLLQGESCSEVITKLSGLIRQHSTDWPSFSALPLLNVTNTKVA